MVNQSKKSDLRCWSLWKASGAVGTPDFSFRLPGAERFSQYLEEKLNGTVTAVGPKALNPEHNSDFVKQWTVFLNGKEIGKYTTHKPSPGENNFFRQFSGRIPGYVNELAVLANKTETGRKQPVDVVILAYDNWTTEYRYENLGYMAMMVPAPWGRKDGHSKIPFP